MLQIYYGNGKGKTTCAVGLMVRALGAGMKVAFIQFDKGYDGKNEHYHERHILRKLPGIDLFPTGLERMNSDGTFRFGVLEGDLQEAKRGIELAHKAIESTKYDVIVIDEILSARSYHLLQEKDILDIIELYKRNPKPELILTGRGITEEIQKQADLITEFKPIKHYFDKGVPARKGIEF